MGLWKIAWRSIRQRALASTLTGLSMALGVALVVAVLVIHGVVAQSFQASSGLGYNLIVGAKGGKLQLVLNTVYYLSSPVENIPYSYYKEFTDGRFKAYCDRVIPVCLGDYYQDFRVVGTTPAMFDDLEYGDGQKYTPQGRNFKTENFFEAVIGATVAQTTGLKIGDEVQPRHGVGEDAHVHDGFKVVGILAPTETPNDRGVFINIEGFYLLDGHALGESHGTVHAPHAAEDHDAEPHEAEHDALEHHDDEHHEGDDHKAEPQPGDHDEHDADHHEEHATEKHVEADHDHAKEHDEPDHAEHPDHNEHDHASKDHAEEPGHDEHAPDEHPDSDHEHAEHAHDEAGHDEHGHDEHGHDEHGHDAHAHHHHSHAPLPESQRQVTAILIRNASFGGAPPEALAPGLMKTVNRERVAQIVQPISEIYNLFSIFVRPIQWILLGLTVLIVIVSGIGILVSIYNSMNDRRREIAIMRALGAGRRTVMTIVLLESILLSLLSGVAGWLLGHALMAALSPWVSTQTGVSIGFWRFATFQLAIMPGGSSVTVPYEAVIVPGLVVLASVVGFLPALVAYRTDVAKALAASP